MSVYNDDPDFHDWWREEHSSDQLMSVLKQIIVELSVHLVVCLFVCL